VRAALFVQDVGVFPSDSANRIGSRKECSRAITPERRTSRSPAA